MAENTNLANYVKFLRGTPTAYAALPEKDADTLYFIVAKDATVGKLYLGNILVAGGVNAEGDNIVDSLGELVDVNLAGLKTGQVLGFNGTEWVPTTLPEAVTGSVMAGATATTAGTSGYVPAPQAGDENKFLRGDGSWADVPTTNVDLTEYAKKTEVETMLDELDDDFVNSSEVEAINTKITELEEEHDAMQDSVTWGTI
jgi:hypothetical protein